MRDIVFKAKRIDNGEWVEGFYCKRKHYCFDKRTDELKTVIMTEFSSGGLVCYEVNPGTVCQYTGLTDKNGNKIWENDVVEVKNDKHHFISQIEWDNWCKGFMFQDTKTTACGMDAISDSGCYRFGCKVIGNIFDNPELIGEQNG